MKPPLIAFVILLSVGRLTDLKESEQIPHADVIERLVASYGIYKETGLSDPVFEYILDGSAHRRGGDASRNLDIQTLDLPSLRRLVDHIGRTTMQREKTDRHSRRVGHDRIIKHSHEETQVNNRANDTTNTLIAFDLMEQSIYATRYRLEQTKRFRKRYSRVTSYHVAFLYGSITQLALKMDNYYAQMEALHHCKFYHYLFLYEKILSVCVDITNSVERVWLLHKEASGQMGPVVDISEEKATEQPTNVTK